jgi:chemotaxis protein CheX
MSAQEIKLPESLDLTAAKPLYEAISEAKGSNITVDASAVTHFGAQCLQILLTADKAWQGQDLQFNITNPSNVFLDSLTMFGLPHETFANMETQ